MVKEDLNELDVYKVAFALFCEREATNGRLTELEKAAKNIALDRDALDNKLAREREIYKQDREGWYRTLTDMESANERLWAEAADLRHRLESVSDATLDLVGGVLEQEDRPAMPQNKLGFPCCCLSCGEPKVDVSEGYFCDPCFDADHARGDACDYLFDELVDAWDGGARDFPRPGKNARG